MAFWGLVTHVRRRLFFGASVVFVAVLLLILPPLVTAAPGWSGVSLWIVLAVLGAVAMALAAFLERGRSRMKHLITHIGHLLDDWE